VVGNSHPEPKRGPACLAGQHGHDVGDGKSHFAIGQSPQQQKQAVERALEVGLTKIEVVLHELEHLVEELDRLRRQQLVALLQGNTPGAAG
jgi:hypothetical protein